MSNKFKKAQESRIAVGHKPEKIADLMTAGIKEKKEAIEKVDKTPELQSEISVSESSTTLLENFEIKSDNIIASPIDNSDNITPSNKSAIPIANTNHEINVPIFEQAELTQSISNSTFSNIETNKTNATDILTNNSNTENIALTTEQFQNPAVSQISNPTPIIIEDTPSLNNNPIINEAYEKVTLVTPTQNTEIPIPIPVVPQTFSLNEQLLNASQQQSSIEIPANQFAQSTPNTVVPSVAAPHAESTPKKKIPNIFAPKEEAKSMRKSLVLKPTSVKKAENYCSKNGGSFNELIQTLLDNFIDEYEL